MAQLVSALQQPILGPIRWAELIGDVASAGCVRFLPSAPPEAAAA